MFSSTHMWIFCDFISFNNVALYFAKNEQKSFVEQVHKEYVKTIALVSS